VKPAIQVTPSGVAGVLGDVEVDASALFVPDFFDELHAASSAKHMKRTTAVRRPCAT
jgi:hypothetical protein